MYEEERFWKSKSAQTNFFRKYINLFELSCNSLGNPVRQNLSMAFGFKRILFTVVSNLFLYWLIRFKREYGYITHVSRLK